MFHINFLEIRPHINRPVFLFQLTKQIPFGLTVTHPFWLDDTTDVPHISIYSVGVVSNQFLHTNLPDGCFVQHLDKTNWLDTGLPLCRQFLCPHAVAPKSIMGYTRWSYSLLKQVKGISPWDLHFASNRPRALWADCATNLAIYP